MFFFSHKKIQSMRYKLIIPSSTSERRYASWIGGSILASLVNSFFLFFLYLLYSLIVLLLFLRIHFNKCGFPNKNMKKKEKDKWNVNVRENVWNCWNQNNKIASITPKKIYSTITLLSFHYNSI